MRPASEEIARLLHKVPGRSYNVFREWAQAVEDMLDRLPFLLQSVIDTGKMCDDPPEMQDRFRRLHETYGDYGMKLFGQATAVLLEGSEAADGSISYVDVIGNTYMLLEIGNTRAGQYFTPQPIAEAMARMIMGDTHALLHSRLQEAASRCFFTQMIGFDTMEDLTRPHVVDYLLPFLIDLVEPITVHDPACGSGVMLLTSAKQFPPWAVHYGIVQFFGQDIDALCCQLARINCKLYGLRGSKISGEKLRAIQRLDREHATRAVHTAAAVATSDIPAPEITPVPEKAPPRADFRMDQLDLFAPLRRKAS